MNVSIEQIDKHYLIIMGCTKRIAHNKEEAVKIMAEHADKYFDALRAKVQNTRPEEDTSGERT